MMSLVKLKKEKVFMHKIIIKLSLQVVQETGELNNKAKTKA